MLTVLRAQGFRFYSWSHEPNEPPHVHVGHGGASAKVRLQPVTLASNAGYPARDLGAMLLAGPHASGWPAGGMA